MNYKLLTHKWVRGIDPCSFEPHYRCTYCGLEHSPRHFEEHEDVYRSSFCNFAYYYTFKQLSYERGSSISDGYVKYDHDFVVYESYFKCTKCNRSTQNLDNFYTLFIPCYERKSPKQLELPELI